MFELIIGTNTNRDKVPTPYTSTVREALLAADIDYSIGVLHLDGATLRPEDLNKTFEELGVRDRASLINVVKGDAA